MFRSYNKIHSEVELIASVPFGSRYKLKVMPHFQRLTVKLQLLQVDSLD